MTSELTLERWVGCVGLGVPFKGPSLSMHVKLEVRDVLGVVEGRRGSKMGTNCEQSLTFPSRQLEGSLGCALLPENSGTAPRLARPLGFHSAKVDSPSVRSVPSAVPAGRGEHNTAVNKTDPFGRGCDFCRSITSKGNQHVVS